MDLSISSHLKLVREGRPSHVAPGHLTLPRQQVVKRLDRIFNFREREEGHQVTRVGGHDDKHEQPPETNDYPTRIAKWQLGTSCHEHKKGNR